MPTRRDMLLAFLAASLGRMAFGQGKPKNLVTPQTQLAIDRGLAWLAAKQREDGSFGSGGGFGRNVAVSALGGIALLSSGSTPGRGPYGSNVNRAVDFVLSVAKPNGFLHVKEQESYGPMYGHGFATLFLAEVYGMSRRVDVREKLDRAVRLIVQTQNSEGGWRISRNRKRQTFQPLSARSWRCERLATRDCMSPKRRSIAARSTSRSARMPTADSGISWCVVAKAHFRGRPPASSRCIRPGSTRERK